MVSVGLSNKDRGSPEEREHCLETYVKVDQLNGWLSSGYTE
jgi:hypothetical protein